MFSKIITAIQFGTNITTFFRQIQFSGNHWRCISNRLRLLIMYYQKRTSLFFWRFNFPFPPKKLNHAGYLVNFELFYGDICYFDFLSVENLYLLKTKTKNVALFSYSRTNSTNMFLHLSEREFYVFKNHNTNISLFKIWQKQFYS